MVKGMDRKPPQVLIEARLIEVNTSKVEEMGIDWEKITKWTTNVVEGYHGAGPAGQQSLQEAPTRDAHLSPPAAPSSPGSGTGSSWQPRQSR